MEDQEVSPRDMKEGIRVAHTVFISYSHKDYALADAVARYLDRHGFETWIDRGNGHILARDDWMANVDDAVEHADAVVGILTRDSVRRPEVIRELYLALGKGHVDATGREGSLTLLVVGDVHDSWFYQAQGEASRAIIDYKHRYQHVKLNPHGDITTEAMRDLERSLRQGASEAPEPLPSAASSSQVEYVCETGMPKLSHDATKSPDGDAYDYYRVQPTDLARSTVYPFALDNQWVPKSIDRIAALRSAFASEGFASRKVRIIVNEAQLDNLYLALIHARQVIVNKSAFLNSESLRSLYADADGATGQQEAFRQLLENGSLVVFLYGSHEVAPASKTTEYETNDGAINRWNRLCRQVRMYCIREAWSNDLDRHSIDFVKFGNTLADDVEQNIRIGRSLGLRMGQEQHFLATLKDISVQSFIQTRFTGSNVFESMRGLSRSYFYRNFIVRKKDDDPSQPAASKPVVNCLFDDNKPFCRQLKRIVDTFYNSLFTNYFGCRPMFPSDTEPQDLFLNEVYLSHGTTEVSFPELEYALAEFIHDEQSFEDVEIPGSLLDLTSWDLQRISRLRSMQAWNDYVDCVEASIDRVQEWRFDFGAVAPIARAFAAALRTFAQEEGFACEEPTPLVYSFRICIGSGVVDLVIGRQAREIREYPGTYGEEKAQHPLLVFFQLGNITRPKATGSILAPTLLFDGTTDYAYGQAYYDAIRQFAEDNRFVEVIVNE